MAVTYQNNGVVRDGLVFYADPSNQRSWVGPDSSTVNDLIGTPTGSIFNDTSGSYGDNNSFEFDGVDDMIDSQTLFTIGTGDFSISLWTKWTTTSTTYLYMMDFRDSSITSNLNFYFEKTDSNNAGIEVYYSNVVLDGASGTSIPKDTWKNITISRNSGTIASYINGAQDQSTSFTSNIALPPKIRFGARYTAPASNQNYLFGNIGPIQIYNKALSASEVKQNYNALKGRFE
jgi:hypothetical protein